MNSAQNISFPPASSPAVFGVYLSAQPRCAFSYPRKGQR